MCFCCLSIIYSSYVKKKLYLCKSDKWDIITVIINLINLILWHLKDKS